MPDKKVLAMYIRLSAEDGDLRTTNEKTESNSVSNQRKLLLDYFNRNLAEEYAVMEFCDDGFSGTNFNRPQFQKMMEMIRAHEVHCIMVKDLSRFGREYLEVGGYLELILPIFGTRFISVNDNFDSNNYSGTTGGIELALRNLINGMYSQDLSLKVRSAIRTRNKQGQYYGGYSFYGYLLNPKDKHRLIVDEAVRGTVFRIYCECIEGKSMAQIAAGLNDDGIETPSEHKKRYGQKYNGRCMEGKPIWLASTIRQILSDERYTGKMISGKRETVGIGTGKMRSLPKNEWIVVPGTHEAIISEEMFEAAAEARRSRIRTVNDNTSGFRAGNLFVCGYCGRKLQKSNGKTTHLYCMKARTVQDSPCASIHEPMETLQENALHTVRTLAKAMLEKRVQQQAQNDVRIPRLEKELRRAKDNIARIKNGKLDLYERYRSGRISKEKFQSIQKGNELELQRLQQTVEAHEAELEKIRAADKSSLGNIAAAQELWALSEYNPKIIRHLIERIRVYEGGHLEIEMKSHSPLESPNKGQAPVVRLTQ